MPNFSKLQQKLATSIESTSAVGPTYRTMGQFYSLLLLTSEKTYVCKIGCLVSGSLVTYAVKPTAEDPFPDVY